MQLAIVTNRTTPTPRRASVVFLDCRVANPDNTSAKSARLFAEATR